MTDRSLRDLAADPEMAAALEAVYESAEGGDGTVGWTDVREEVGATEWGRLLGEDVLLSVGDRFVIDDPTGVETVLAERDERSPDDADGAVTESEPDPDADDESRGWTRADKFAGIVALALMGGYQITAIRDAVAGAVDVVLGPVVGAVPFPALLFCLAAGVAVTSTSVRRRFGGAEMSGIKERTESLREDLRRAREREDEAAIERLEAEQREVMADQLGAMKGQFRPLVWTMLLTIPVFMWLTWLTVDPVGAVVSASTFIPVLGEIVWTARVLGPVQAWILWYALCSLVASVATRRALDRVGIGTGA